MDVFTDTYIPDTPIGRTDKRDQLVDEIDRYQTQTQPGGVRVSGPRGSGKTTLTRLALDKYAADDAANVTTAYASCWECETAADLLQTINAQLESTQPIQLQSVSDPHTTPAFASQLTISDALARVTETDRQVIVVIDDAGHCDTPTLWYELFTERNLFPILVTRSETLATEHLNQPLIETLQAVPSLTCELYSDDILEDILAHHARQAFAQPGLTDRQRTQILSHADGDAQQALSILHRAGVNADRGDSAQVRMTDITRGIETISPSIRQKTIATLTSDHRTLYQIIRDAGRIAPRDMYARYRQSVSEPRTERTVRNYLSDLEQHNLIEKRGQTKARRYIARN